MRSNYKLLFFSLIIFTYSCSTEVTLNTKDSQSNINLTNDSKNKKESEVSNNISNDKTIDSDPKILIIQSFYTAIKQNNILDIKTLMSKGFSFSNLLSGDENPLVLASELGRKEIVELFLSKKNELGITDENIYNSLIVAITNEKKEIVDILRKEDVELRYIKDLIKTNKLKTKENTNIPLLKNAAITGNIEVAEILLKNGFDIEGNKESNTVAYYERFNAQHTPLTIATKYNNQDMVEFLISERAQIRLHSYDLISSAIKNKNYNLLKLFILHGVDVNNVPKYKESCLFKALQEKDFEASKILIQNGIDLKYRNNSNKSVLGMAIDSGNREIISLLVRREANVDDEDSFIYMTRFARSGDKELLELFIKNGSPPTVKGFDNNTLLMEASKSGNIEIVEFLLTIDKSNINAKNNDGNTVIMMALQGNNIDTAEVIIKILIKNGADISIENFKGETPISYASKLGYTNILNTLLSK